MWHGYAEGAAPSGLDKIPLALHMERVRTNEMAAAAGGKRSDVVGVLSHQRFAGVAGIVTTLTVMKLGPWHMKKIGTYVGLGCSSEQAIVPAYRFFQAWIDVA